MRRSYFSPYPINFIHPLPFPRRNAFHTGEAPLRVSLREVYSPPEILCFIHENRYVSATKLVAMSSTFTALALAPPYFLLGFLFKKEKKEKKKLRLSLKFLRKKKKLSKPMKLILKRKWASLNSFFSSFSFLSLLQRQFFFFFFNQNEGRMLILFFFAL